MSIWIDKYRPLKLNDISGHTDIINIFRNYVKTKTVPNIIIHGEPGSGKTSSILAMARELYGEEHFKTEVYELNASDERGIDTVRNKIHNLAKKSVASPVGFKLIILDEADFLTKDAQAALRKIMEKYSDKTIFCLLCNYIYKIIPPIKSRCAPFYFKPLTVDEIKNQLIKISTKENIKVDESVIDFIIKLSAGDLRKAIILLQQTNFNENIKDLIGIVDESIYEKIFMNKINNKELYETIDDIYNKGYNISNIVKDIFDYTLSKDFEETKKQRIIQLITNTDKNINLGCNEYLNFLHLCISINNIFNE
jgi:DNA polymerase III delta prime subunit